MVCINNAVVWFGLFLSEAELDVILNYVTQLKRECASA